MNIYESLNKVMAQIGAIGKNSKNSSQGFMYRGIDAVMNALQPALIENKVFVVPEVIEQTREERVNSKGTTLIYSIAKTKYRFFAEDGTFVEATVIGEGMDSGDKSMNKAMSVAFKYACFQVLCIPTEEMVDPDAESHEVKQEVLPPATFPIVYINPQQKAKILHEMNRTGVTAEMICERYKIKVIDDLPENRFDKLYKNLLATESVK